MNEPGKTGLRPSGLGFESALRTCFLGGVLLFDAQTGTVTSNPEARQILGLSTQGASELNLDDLPGALARVAREALTSGQSVSTHQLELSMLSGPRSVQVSAVPLRSLSKTSGVVLTLQSLSITSPFLQQIRQLDRLANTGALAAGMAHEIRNALVAGRTFLDLLLEKNTDAELVQIVRRETARIDAIVSRMLRFASANTSSRVVVHLHQVLEHALRLVQPQLDAKSIALERSFRATSDVTRGDEYELEQAFVNLLFNGLEAMSPEGRLTINTTTVATSSKEKHQLQTVIQDSGSGILPEHIPHLFEPFFTTKPAGTGLGLAITRRIIEEHGGTITAKSSPGHGTVFTVLLPVVPETSDAQLGGLAAPMLGASKA